MRMLNIPKDIRFDTPSGRRYDYDDLFLIRELAKNDSFAWSNEEVRFNSGFKCNVYLRMRNDLTENIPLLCQVGARIKSFVLRLKRTHGPQFCLIGIPTAGTPIAQAAARESYDPYHMLESRICFRQLRTELKANHGKDNLWAGRPELERHSYVTIENVISTAKAYLKHLKHLEEDGYPTTQMQHVAFADWGLGGAETLAKEGYTGFAMYRALDMIAALVFIGDWPEEYYNETERRINQWRKDTGLHSAA